MNQELEEIRIQKQAAKKVLDALEIREREIYAHDSDARTINADEVLLKDDVQADEVNYILGNSRGYVNGFIAAINTIVAGLASEYRDIPITESELYLLTELGEMKERAWLKDHKSREVAEKNGWFHEWREIGRQAWVKKETEEKKEPEQEKEDT